MFIELSLLLSSKTESIPVSKLAIREVLQKVPLVRSDDKLVVGIEPEDYMKGVALYFIRGRKATRINSRSDLNGKVRVKTKSAALSIARLMCSPLSTAVFPSPWECEIVERESVADTYVFGIGWLKDRMKESDDGGYGTIGWKLFRRLGFTAPVVRKVDGGYKIRRFLVLLPYGRSATQAAFQVDRVEEFVGFSGNYRVIASSPFTYQLTDADSLTWGFFGRHAMFR